MASPLDDVITTIVADVEALVPETRATIRYFYLDGSMTPRVGATSDRGFGFSIPSAEVLSLRGSVAETRYTFDLILLLTEQSMSPHAFRQAVYSEANAVRAAIDARSVWPAGVISVVTRGYDVATDSETRDVEVSITLSVVTEDN